MAGIEAVEKAYNVDRTRIAVSGWSYGGYMTSWMIGHYNIWKAAVSGAALNDWFDDYNVSFYVYTDVPWFGGSPWDPRYTAMWRAQSPIAYVQQIRTPTLILGDIGDNNVTITNSFKMFHALRDNGVPVQFVAYPVHGHFPGDPVRSEDVSKRWLSWLDRYLR
jgi:dipeptidyl aminopeptidase/acylaminoacyl peptidase